MICKVLNMKAGKEKSIVSKQSLSKAKKKKASLIKKVLLEKQKAEAEKQKPKKCASWLRCPFEEAIGYELSAVVHCRNCDKTSKVLHLVHEEAGGDYFCYQCNGDVSAAYFCYYCHNKEML